ncbi:LOW QUALITY PROTEIN: hypothetical protein ACHAW6_001084, partial [Cyclotella cf. meneghiniana]
MTIRAGNPSDAAGARKVVTDKLVNSVYLTPGCTNPPDLNTTALLDTSANIFLLTPQAPAQITMTTLPPKTIMQPSDDTLTTSGNVTLLVPKLPPAAKEVYRIAGLTNNLLSALSLADVGCELFFHQTGCEVMHNREIILRGWHDPTTRLWRVPLQSNENNIVPLDTNIVLPTKSLPQSHSIYECENTHQLINFYYATMGYPAISTWCKAINRGYFRGWPGLTSTR